MIKWLTRWCFRLLVLALLLLLGGLLMLDTLSREVAEKRLEDLTGLGASIGRMEVGLLSPRIRMENVLLYNTAEYGGAPVLSVPELCVEYDRSALWGRHLRLSLVRLQVAELHVVEGPNGRLNLEAVQERIRSATGASSNAPVGGRRWESFGGIGTLNLSLGRLRYSSLRRPETRGYYNLEVEHWVRTNVMTTEEIFNALHGLARQKGLEWLWDRLAGKTAPGAGPRS